MISNEMVVQPRSVIHPQKARQRILIVDDDHSQAEVLSIGLNQQGFCTLSVGTGCGGLRLARSERPDLVLLDLRLPDVDGLHICQQLSDDSRTRDIPIIIISGMERPDIVRSSRAAGCHYFVRKPYDPNALLLLVQNAIQDRNAW